MSKRKSDGRRVRDSITVLVAMTAVVVACNGDGTGPRPRVDGLDTISIDAYLDSIVAVMPGEDSNGYDPPTAAERAGMVGVLQLARAGDLEGADAQADAFGYDIDVVIDDVHGDTVVALVERAPVQHGWGTYVFRPRGIPVDIHLNHPLYDLFTPEAGAALFDACRCRALLMAGTHRYANGSDESDMARSTTSVFQAVHEWLADDADMAISVHNFARTLHGGVTGESDAVLSLGVNEDGEFAVNQDARALRDALRADGFVVGLVADDDGYNQLTGEPNPQGRYSNTAFGHGRWIHVELAAEMFFLSSAWEPIPGIIADWLDDITS